MIWDLWPALERALPLHPPQTFAGAETWGPSEIAALRDRWVAERLAGRGELERILERTADHDRVETLLDVSLRRTLLATGTGRLMAEVHRARHAVEAMRPGTPPAAVNAASLADELASRAERMPEPRTRLGFLLLSAPLPLASVGGVVENIAELADGVPPAEVVREAIARYYGLALGVRPLVVPLLPVAPEVAAAAVHAKLASAVVEHLQSDAEDADARAVVAAFVAEVAGAPAEASALDERVRGLVAGGVAPQLPPPPPAIPAVVELSSRIAARRRRPGQPVRRGEIGSPSLRATGPATVCACSH